MSAQLSPGSGSAGHCYPVPGPGRLMTSGPADPSGADRLMKSGHAEPSGAESLTKSGHAEPSGADRLMKLGHAEPNGADRLMKSGHAPVAGCNSVLPTLTPAGICADKMAPNFYDRIYDTTGACRAMNS